MILPIVIHKIHMPQTQMTAREKKTQQQLKHSMCATNRFVDSFFSCASARDSSEWCVPKIWILHCDKSLCVNNGCGGCRHVYGFASTSNMGQRRTKNEARAHTGGDKRHSFNIYWRFALAVEKIHFTSSFFFIRRAVEIYMIPSAEKTKWTKVPQQQSPESWKPGERLPNNL